MPSLSNGIAFLPFDLRDLVCSHDGRLSPSKTGTLIAGVTFTLKMLGVLPDASPDDPWLWLIYMATVGAIDVAKKALSMRADKLRGPGDPE
jgi:hypothetical protein